MSGFFDRTGQSFAPVLMVRVSVTVTLINFVMTMILMFSSQPNVYDMTARKRESAQVREGPVVSQGEDFEAKVGCCVCETFQWHPCLLTKKAKIYLKF